MAKKSNLTKHLERSGSLGKMTDAEVVMAEAILSNIDIDRISGPFLKAIASQIGERVGKGLMNNRSLIYNAPSWGKGSVSPDSTTSQSHYVGVDLGAAGKVKAMMESRRLGDLRRSRFDAQWNMYFDEKGNRKRLLPDSMYPTSVGNINTAGKNRNLFNIKKYNLVKRVEGDIRNNLSYLYTPSVNSITDTPPQFDPSQSPLIAREIEEASIDAEVQRRIESGRARASSYNSQVRSNKYRKVAEEGKERRENRYRYLRLQASRRHEAFQQFPWLKPLAKSNPIIAKNLPDIAKALKKGAKTPIIGHFIKHPYMAAAGLALGAIMKAAHAAGSVAKSVPLETMSGLSLANLITGGHEISAWGGSKEDIAKSATSFAAKQGMMMVGLGDTSHLKTLAAFGIDIRGSGRYGMLSSNERFQRVSRAIREAHEAGDFERVSALASAAGFSAPMVEGAIRGYDFSDVNPAARIMSSKPVRGFGEKINRLIDNPLLELTDFARGKDTIFSNRAMQFAASTLIPDPSHAVMAALRWGWDLFSKNEKVEDAVRSAEDYTKNKTSGLIDQNRNVNMVWNLGGISLPEVTDIESFKNGIGSLTAEFLKTYAKPVLDANDSLMFG